MGSTQAKAPSKTTRPSRPQHTATTHLVLGVDEVPLRLGALGRLQRRVLDGHAQPRQGLPARRGGGGGSHRCGALGKRPREESPASDADERVCGLGLACAISRID